VWTRKSVGGASSGWSTDGLTFSFVEATGHRSWHKKLAGDRPSSACQAAHHVYRADGETAIPDTPTAASVVVVAFSHFSNFACRPAGNKWEKKEKKKKKKKKKKENKRCA